MNSPRKHFAVLLVTVLALLVSSCGTKLKDIVFVKDSVSIAIGDTYQLAVVATPEDAEYDATWQSSDEIVASVDDKGIVVGKSVGTCEITIIADGKSASCTVVVTDGDDIPDSESNITSYGAVNSCFSVGEGKVVQFSRGNLQFQASTGLWRFAKTQWGCQGGDNQYVSSDASQWIDLFGWGTSGAESGAVAYKPYSTDTDDSHYFVGGDAENNLTGSNAAGDWGRTNRISGYSGRDGYWRVLTNDEWKYLFGSNAVRSNRWGLATINGVYHGVVLLPDTWTAPEDIAFTSGLPYGYETNKYTYPQWIQMQKSGAVFLPTGGVRNGQSVEYVNIDGYYWSSTSDGNAAHTVYIGGDAVTPGVSRYRHLGLSVRLVTENF